MKILWGIFICFICLGDKLLAQSDSSAADTDDLLESISPAEDNETEENTNYELLEKFTVKPFDLNKADLSELQSIPFIDFITAKKIIDHRLMYGRFFSKAELYSVSGIDPDLISKLLNFVTISEYHENPLDTLPSPPIKDDIHLNFRSRIIYNLVQKDEYLKGVYAGSPLKFYNRVNFNYNNLSLGMLTEKDPGEKAINDFTSLYLQLRNFYNLKKLIVGDFNLQIGQGLIAYGPYALMKSSEAIIPVKGGRENMSPYQSINENIFFRGAAAEFLLGNVELLLFYSRKTIDASVDSLGFITSVRTDGYHRTASEIGRQNNAAETTRGAGIGFQYDEMVRLQLFHLRTHFSRPRITVPFTGDEFYFTSLSYHLNTEKFNITGETAYDGYSPATINYLSFAISRDIKIINSFRWYPGFLSLHGNPFAENNSLLKNEIGFYSGLNYKSPVGEFNLYFDQFRLVSKGFFLQGNEWLFGYNIKLKPAELIVTYRNKRIDNDYSGNNIYKKLKQNYVVELRYKVSKSIKTKTRIHYKNVFDQFTKSPAEGYLFFHEMVYSFSSLQLYGRITLFKTDNFDSAVYQYENNLPGIFQNVPLYGEGLRWYFLVRYKIFKTCRISFKYSETIKPESVLNYENNLYLDNNLGVQAEIDF